MSSEPLERALANLRERLVTLEQERDEHAKRADENLDQGMAEYHRRVAAERAEQSLKAMLAATVERAEKAERVRDDAIGGRDDLPMAHEILALLKSAEAALAVAHKREQRLRELAKRAKSQAADPDYDGMPFVLWAVVDAALADEPAAAMLVGKHPKSAEGNTVDLAAAVDAAADEPGETP